MKLRGPLAKLVNWWRGYPAAVVTEAPPTPKLEWRPAPYQPSQMLSHHSQMVSSDHVKVIRQIKADIESTLLK